MDDFGLTVLPGVLGEVAHLTSNEVAIALARRFGGRRVHIARELRRNHPFVPVVGIKAARLIGRALYDKHGEIVILPSIKPLLRAMEARRLRARGKSNAQIAEALGIGLRRVQQMVGGLERPEVTEAPAPAPSRQFCPCCGRRLSRPHQGEDTAQLALPLP